jgi:hypothetical protein
MVGLEGGALEELEGIAAEEDGMAEDGALEMDASDDGGTLEEAEGTDDGAGALEMATDEIEAEMMDDTEKLSVEDDSIGTDGADDEGLGRQRAEAMPKRAGSKIRILIVSLATK